MGLRGATAEEILKGEVTDLFKTTRGGVKLTVALVLCLVGYFLGTLRIEGVDEVNKDDPSEMEEAASEGWLAQFGVDLPKPFAMHVRKWAGEVPLPSGSPSKGEGVIAGDQAAAPILCVGCIPTFISLLHLPRGYLTGVCFFAPVHSLSVHSPLYSILGLSGFRVVVPPPLERLKPLPVGKGLWVSSPQAPQGVPAGSTSLVYDQGVSVSFTRSNMMDMESLNIAGSKSSDDWLPVWPSEEAPVQFVEEYFRKAIWPLSFIRLSPRLSATRGQSRARPRASTWLSPSSTSARRARWAEHNNWRTRRGQAHRARRVRVDGTAGAACN